ncbi:UNVERIFIED_CONTAM: hypothetical protein PYX00_004214 [Menopon gallinae]|uniref:Uncharacterized protein n=1 Tax=Menopon gallinae TaxID=328185 RepID=A0AAW2I4D7_9NEOP
MDTRLRSVGMRAWKGYGLSMGPVSHAQGLENGRAVSSAKVAIVVVGVIGMQESVEIGRKESVELMEESDVPNLVECLGDVQERRRTVFLGFEGLGDDTSNAVDLLDSGVLVPEAELVMGKGVGSFGKNREHDYWHKFRLRALILSFLLLVVLQSVMTEGKEACPAGMTADKTGKCVATFEQIVPLGGLRAPQSLKDLPRYSDADCPFPHFYEHGRCLRNA